MTVKLTVFVPETKLSTALFLLSGVGLISNAEKSPVKLTRTHAQNVQREAVSNSRVDKQAKKRSSSDPMWWTHARRKAHGKKMAAAHARKAAKGLKWLDKESEHKSPSEQMSERATKNRTEDVYGDERLTW